MRTIRLSAARDEVCRLVCALEGAGEINLDTHEVSVVVRPRGLTEAEHRLDIKAAADEFCRQHASMCYPSADDNEAEIAAKAILQAASSVGLPTAPPRFFFDQDDDCHWYIVQADKRAEWDAWRAIPGGDERGWEVPAFAKRMYDGGPEFYTFSDPRSVF